jgi:hypothetical protein
MRRVVAYSMWRATWWEGRINLRVGLSLDLQEGLRAYAIRQSTIHACRATHLQMQWSVSGEQAQNPLLSHDWVPLNLVDTDAYEDSAEDE